MGSLLRVAQAEGRSIARYRFGGPGRSAPHRSRLKELRATRYDISMSVQEAERGFLSRLGECLLSLPFDLKVLQEAASDPNLDRAAREIAAGAILHTLLPQEGEGPLRYADDVLLVRAALAAVSAKGGEGASAFRERFADVYDRLDEDITVFKGELGELWSWLATKIDTYPRVVYKGKRAAQYTEDDDGLALLYEEGLEFETNYNVNEDHVRNRVRRVEQVTELLKKRHADESKKIG